MSSKHVFLLCSALLLSGPTARGEGGSSSDEPPHCTAKPQCMQYFKQAERQVLAKNYSAALSNFQSAYAVAADPNLLINIGRCLYNLNRWNESLAHYRLFYTYKVPLPPENEARLQRFIKEAQHASIYTEATQLYAAASYEQALQKFQSAYEIDPQPRDFINIGRCQHQLGRYSDALQSYEQFSKAERTATPRDIALAKKYIFESKSALMQQQLSQAKAESPSAKPPEGGAGLRGDKGGGARRVVLKPRTGLLPAFPIDPNQRSAEYQAGLRLFEGGQYGLALPKLQAALAATSNQRITIYIGRCFFLMGQPQEALRQYEQLESSASPLAPPERAVLSELLSEARAAVALAATLRADQAQSRRDVQVAEESR